AAQSCACVTQGARRVPWAAPNGAFRGWLVTCLCAPRMLHEPLLSPPRGGGGTHALSRRLFERDGYLHVPGAVDGPALSRLTRELADCWREQVRSGAMFSGGGNWSG